MPLPIVTMATPSSDQLFELIDSLKKSINEFYAKYSDLDANGTIDMRVLLRRSDKLQLFMDGDYHALWQMEKEDSERNAKAAEEECKKKEQAMAELANALSSLEKFDSRIEKTYSETLRVQDMVNRCLSIYEDETPDDLPDLIPYQSEPESCSSPCNRKINYEPPSPPTENFYDDGYWHDSGV